MTRGREPSAISSQPSAVSPRKGQPSAGVGKGLRITVYPSGMTDIVVEQGSFDERDIMAIYLAVRDAIHQPGRPAEREPLRQTIERLDHGRGVAVPPAVARAQPTEPVPTRGPESPRGAPPDTPRPKPVVTTVANQTPRATNETPVVVHQAPAKVHGEPVAVNQQTGGGSTSGAKRAKPKPPLADDHIRAATAYLVRCFEAVTPPEDDGVPLEALVADWESALDQSERRRALRHVAFYDTRFEIRSLGTEVSPKPHVRRVAIEGGIRTIGGAG